jgi:UDP-N-acetyl-D-mannosaminuronic acid dehydrogenase
VDPWFIVNSDETDTELIKTARNTNDHMPEYVASVAKEILRDVENPIITLFGVAYKGNIGDTRQSPAIGVFSELRRRGFEVRAYDPIAENFQYELQSLETAVESSDCILVLAEHDVFNSLDLENIHSLMRNKLVIDTKNCLSPSWERAGFSVRVLGNG